MTEAEGIKKLEEVVDEANQMARKHIDKYLESVGCESLGEYLKKYCGYSDEPCEEGEGCSCKVGDS